MKILSDSLFSRKVKEEIEKRRRREQMVFMYEDKDGNTVTCRSHLTEEDILNAKPVTEPKILKILSDARKKCGIED